MPRKIKPPIDFWALPAPVQDSILEQLTLICYSIERPRALKLRLVCKHFDKQVKRLVYGGDVLDTWPHLRLFDPTPLRLSLIEGAKSRKHRSRPLIKLLQSAIKMMTSELEFRHARGAKRVKLSSPSRSLANLRLSDTSEPDDADLIGQVDVAAVVFDIAAAGLCNNSRFLVEHFMQADMELKGLPPSLVAAFGWKDIIDEVAVEMLEVQDDIFGRPLEAAGYYGHVDVVQTILERTGSYGTYHEKALRLVGRTEHVETTKVLLEGVDVSQYPNRSAFADGLHEAVRARRLETLKILLAAYMPHGRNEGNYFFSHLLRPSIWCGTYDILEYLLEVLDEQIPKGDYYYWRRRFGEIGECIQAAVSHPHDGPLEQLLRHGFDPKALTTTLKPPCRHASRVSTFRTLHAYGMDLSPHMSWFLTRAVRHDWVKVIAFLGSVKKLEDQKAFDSALASAVSKRHPNSARALLNAGADPLSLCKLKTQEQWDEVFSLAAYAPDTRIQTYTFYGNDVVIGTPLWWYRITWWDTYVYKVKYLKSIAYPYVGEL